MSIEALTWWKRVPNPSSHVAAAFDLSVHLQRQATGSCWPSHVDLHQPTGAQTLSTGTPGGYGISLVSRCKDHLGTEILSPTSIVEERVERSGKDSSSPASLHDFSL